MLKRSCEVGYDISILHHGYCEVEATHVEQQETEVQVYDYDEGGKKKILLSNYLHPALILYAASTVKNMSNKHRRTADCCTKFAPLFSIGTTTI